MTFLGETVALYMSAWIEMVELTKQYRVYLVALYMSAWIEISITSIE